MQLSKDKAEYIIRFRERLLYRSFLIDALANVADRPMLLVEDTEIHKTKKHVLHIPSQGAVKKKSEVGRLIEETDNSVTTGGAYDPPPKALPKEFDKDEIMQWRTKTGIDIVYKQETPYELIRNYTNWLRMTYEQQQESDKMCRKFFYHTNIEHFKVMMKEFMDDKKIMPGDIVELVNSKTRQICRVYLDEIVGTDMPTSLVFKYLDSGEGRPFSEIDTFGIKKGDIDNYTGGPMGTTVGRFVLNHMLLVDPFKDVIPYWNDKWDLSKIEKDIAGKVMQDVLTVQQLKKYQDNLYFIGHFAELCVPTLSRKALGTSENIDKVKKELMEKHKGNLTNPLVIAEIETYLINLDKEHLKDDSSMRFYGALASKAFNIARKKMYLTVGGIQTFSKDSSEFTFLPNSLSDGWEKEYIPAIANEIRKGSYSRGFETQLGGVQTKLITRVFQDLNIYLPDCGTSRGLRIDFDKYPSNDFIGRYVLYKGVWTEVTEDNKKQFKGTCLMRSPMYCEAPKGLCYMCVGEIFRKLTVKQVAAIEIDISSTFLNLSMKNMHGTKLELFELDNLESYIINKGVI